MEMLVALLLCVALFILGTLMLYRQIRNKIKDRTAKFKFTFAIPFLIAIIVCIITYNWTVEFNMRLYSNVIANTGYASAKKVEKFFKENNRIPDETEFRAIIDLLAKTSPYDSSFRALINSITIDESGVITITAREKLSWDKIAGKTVTFTPNLSKNPITWDCTRGTLPGKYLPKHCQRENKEPE